MRNLGLFICLTVIIGCSRMEYYLESKLKLGAGSPIIYSYKLNYSESVLNKKILEKIQSDQIQIADSILLIKIFGSDNFLKIKRDTSVIFFINENQDIIFSTSILKNNLDEDSAIIVLNSALVLPNNKFNSYEFSYNERLKIINTFKEDVLNYLILP